MLEDCGVVGSQLEQHGRDHALDCGATCYERQEL